MSDSIDVTKLPNLAEMSDEEIDALASKIWESIPQPYLANETAAE